MDFKYDLFISYSGHDNKPLENEKGWVTNFSRFLDTALERLLKRRPRILLSHDLDSSSLMKTSSVEVLSKTIGFISIVSPEYLKSKNLQEAEDFISASQYNGGAEIGDLQRVYEVIKSPVEPGSMPDYLQTQWAYDLFEKDHSTGKLKEFTGFLDVKTETEFWSVLVDLAYDIRNLIYASELDIKKGQKFSGKTIYLSELGNKNHSKQHQLIKRELQKYGYKVVPDRPLQKASKNYQLAINDYLNTSTLSIHLINSDIIEQNAEQSIADAQNSFLADFNDQITKSGGSVSSEKSLPKLVWLSPDIKPSSEKQKIQIEQLKKEIEAVKGAEIIQTPLEVFKSIVHEKVKRDANKPKRTKTNSSYVYLIHAIADRSNIAPIAKSLTEKGFEVLTPSFEGDILNIVENHRQNLVDCDAVLIYYGTRATDQWLKSKLIDIQKAPGFGRTKSMLAKALYIDSELKSQQYIEKYGLISIHGNGGFSDEQFIPFINKIKQ